VIVDDSTLRIERTYQAPVEQVFDAWTSPEVMRRWWQAERGWATSAAEVDLRVGGAVRVVMHDPVKDVEHGGGGRYTEIDRPRRLAFTWLWDWDTRRTLIEIDFEESGGRHDRPLHAQRPVGRGGRARPRRRLEPDPRPPGTGPGGARLVAVGVGALVVIHLARAPAADRMTNIRIEDLDPSGDLRQSADDAGAWDPTGTRRNLLRQAGIGGAAVFGVGALLSPMDAFASASASQKGAYSTSGSKSLRRGKANANDVKIGNYALTLEYLEAAFYAGAVAANYPDPDIAAAAKTIAAHEAAHVAALKKVLGSAAVKAPTVNTDTVAKLLADQNTFITTAASIEPVGTAAYAGAGPYINNLAIVKAALAIHSVEANHAAYTAAIVKFKGIDASADPIPNSFNPAFSFAKTIKTVSSLNLVKGDLQP